MFIFGIISLAICSTTFLNHCFLIAFYDYIKVRLLILFIFSLRNISYQIYFLSCYRVRPHKRWNELIPGWDFKLVSKVLFTLRFISAAFQNNPIFWWTCVGISFQVAFTWYFIIRNQISFLSKLPTWNSYLQWVSNAHAH